ncbi:hypothetical protein G6L46_10320 [Agrobacterium rhizogenes]|uniref:DUF6525 family protein n=1 Tax=Rhizobium rhizogenes TaxID=359 RepID=UPI00157175B2|nr:DUF6525 family protein [Rhizobium rhizogenes]NTF87519.1 hypothetical protein [Rhizobium rhizogenes]
MSTRVEIMATFDRLPQQLRRAIASADFPFDPNWVDNWVARGVAPERIALQIERRDRKAAS